MKWNEQAKNVEYCNFDVYSFGEYMIEKCESFIKEKMFVLTFTQDRHKVSKGIGKFPDSKSAKEYAKKHHEDYVKKLVEECIIYLEKLNKENDK